MAHKTVLIKRNGLTVECFVTTESGKLERKIETYGRRITDYVYRHDEAGRLAKVLRDDCTTEEYHYNQNGQRIEQRREYQGFSDGTRGRLLYDEKGKLLKAGDTTFAYDSHGALSERRDGQGITKYSYGKDTMLDRVTLTDGKHIRYEYAKSNPTGPARRFREDFLTAEFAWKDPTRLSAYRDHDTRLDHAFTYDASGILDRIRITPFTGSPEETGTDWLSILLRQNKRQRLDEYFRQRSGPLDLWCCCDQAGTLKLMADKHGVLIKEVTRDSFGLRYSDSFLDLFVPVGFAGGLTDPDTGLVRFGYRDYDPTVGRFTAPDPAKDRRGDGDLYDYCVDDPVSRVDPTGLWSKLNFDETRVRRDEGGRFSGGTGGGGGAGSQGGELHAMGGRQTATDAGGRPEQNATASSSASAQRVGEKVREAEARPKSASKEEQPTERKYYVIGKRPLDTFLPEQANEFLAENTQGTLEHRQFIADDGSNRGFFPEGFQKDSAENLGKYTYYDTHKYKAKFIDEAIRRYESENGPGPKYLILDYLPFSPADESVFYRESTYNWAAHNCQKYVESVLSLAEKLARQKGESLYYE